MSEFEELDLLTDEYSINFCQGRIQYGLDSSMLNDNWELIG